MKPKLAFVGVFVFAFLIVNSLRCADLPTARELIAEGLKLCPEVAEDNSYPRSYLARALAYLGDFEAARRILSAHKNDIWIEAAYWTLAEQEIARGTAPTPFPKALFDELPDCPHYILAKAYIKHGRIEEALQHVRQMPVSRDSSLKSFAYQIVEPLVQGGHAPASREVLSRWAECFTKTESVFDYRREQRIDRLVGWLHSVGEIGKAGLLCEHWEAIVASDTDLQEHGSYIGMCWAQLADAWAKNNERDRALNALAKARFWLDKDKELKVKANEPHRVFDFVECYAMLAARIRLIAGL